MQRIMTNRMFDAAENASKLSWDREKDALLAKPPIETKLN